MSVAEAAVIVLGWLSTAAAIVALVAGSPLYAIAFGVLALVAVEMTRVP